MIMPTLTGKTALVTGASRGMGRASAHALAAAGAQVLVHYGRGANEADGVVAEIRKAGGRADAIATDLAAADGASKLARQARSIVGDRLDILVANAGVSKTATIEETTIEDFDRLFAVNVRAPFFLVQQLLPIMSKGSSIVFLSSLAARAVVGAIPAYAATKGAIDTLVKHFASMLGARGIRVNAVAPGVVETDMSNFTKTEAGRDFTLGMQALKRLAQPDDVGGVVAFLASEDARWITGVPSTSMAARSSEVCRRKRTLAFLLLDLSSAHEGDNMIKTTRCKTRRSCSKRSIRFSISGTTTRPSGTGHRTTFNTARTSRLGATACSIWLGARH
jgi:3-oxoacyl-[acyl-carrier protein] reductase